MILLQREVQGGRWKTHSPGGVQEKQAEKWRESFVASYHLSLAAALHTGAKNQNHSILPHSQ